MCKQNLGYLLPVAGNIGVFCQIKEKDQPQATGKPAETGTPSKTLDKPNGVGKPIN